jgi:uncharacterized protein (TIGR03032 family)
LATGSDDTENQAAGEGNLHGASPGPTPEQETRITCSRGFGDWLLANRCSLAFTSYQTGELFLIGVLPDGRLSFHQRHFERAMGLHADPQRLYLAGLFQVWRMENVLRPGQFANNAFDRLYVPRNAQVTGDLDIHELSVEPSGRMLFINTLYSCLAAFSRTDSFTPLWKPKFISKLAAEDRCHLNGLAMQDGVARYVTAVCRSDIVNGWRDRRASGGCIIDIATDRIVSERLSMPHSPRIHRDQLYALDSGRGYLVRVDRDNGKLENIAFCPGFLRGLAMRNHYAIVGLSLPRDGAFTGLELDNELKKRDADPWAGLNVIDTKSGDVVQWLRLEGHLRETFAVGVLPEVRCPMAIGLMTPEIRTHITIEEQPLVPGESPTEAAPDNRARTKQSR